MEKEEYKILAVDDNPKNIQVIGSILRKAKYKVGFAFNGQQALDILNESNDYDLILLDVNMPVMNGYETCMQIKKIDALKEIPVIFLTALSEVENIVRGFDAGAQDYVAKPFNAQELLARVQTHVELKVSRQKLKEVNAWLDKKVKERTAELEKANKELQLLDDAKVDFLSMISHEINTPLNGIVGFTNILVEEMKNAEFYEMIHFLDVSAKRLEKFANISLLITELRTKRKKIIFEEVDIDSITNHILPVFDEQIKEKSILIEFKAQTQFIFGDKFLISKVFEYLLDNAVRYSSQSGMISITIYNENDFVICDFADQGEGFHEKILNDPFKLFVFGKEHADENKGLSLALIKMIMDEHKGGIELSNHEKGALVRLRFPLKK